MSDYTIYSSKGHVHVEGSLQARAVLELREYLMREIEKDKGDLRVVMVKCDHLHSSALTVLLDVLPSLKMRKCGIQLFNPPSNFIKIIKLANVVQLFQISHPYSRSE